jgi:hypothetical protein
MQSVGLVTACRMKLLSQLHEGPLLKEMDNNEREVVLDRLHDSNAVVARFLSLPLLVFAGLLLWISIKRSEAGLLEGAGVYTALAFSHAVYTLGVLPSLVLWAGDRLRKEQQRPRGHEPVSRRGSRRCEVEHLGDDRIRVQSPRRLGPDEGTRARDPVLPRRARVAQPVPSPTARPPMADAPPISPAKAHENVPCAQAAHPHRSPRAAIRDARRA